MLKKISQMCYVLNTQQNPHYRDKIIENNTNLLLPSLAFVKPADFQQ